MSGCVQPEPVVRKHLLASHHPLRRNFAAWRAESCGATENKLVCARTHKQSLVREIIIAVLALLLRDLLLGVLLATDPVQVNPACYINSARAAEHNSLRRAKSSRRTQLKLLAGISSSFIRILLPLPLDIQLVSDMDAMERGESATLLLEVTISSVRAVAELVVEAPHVHQVWMTLSSGAPIRSTLKSLDL